MNYWKHQCYSASYFVFNTVKNLFFFCFAIFFFHRTAGRIHTGLSNLHPSFRNTAETARCRRENPPPQSSCSPHDNRAACEDKHAVDIQPNNRMISRQKLDTQLAVINPKSHKIPNVPFRTDLAQLFAQLNTAPWTPHPRARADPAVVVR